MKHPRRTAGGVSLGSTIVKEPVMSSCLVVFALVATLDAPATTIKIAPGDDSHPPGFLVAPEGSPFIPWGFNYDHDEKGRLLEDYWGNEWPKIEQDFAEMKTLGANVVRIHLQVNKFLRSPDEPNADSLARLKKLLEVATRNRLALDITGLGCYRKKDVPEWYDALDEPSRWKAQARFWSAVAETCANSPAVFCYDLMNEPIVPGGTRKAGDWLGPPFGEFCFVQFITLDQKDRPREEIAKKWVETLTAAIRKSDPNHLVTLGLVDWSLKRPKTLYSGFDPKEVSGPLDFLSVHIYPEAGDAKRAEALATLQGFSVPGKPVVIEETFSLKCGIAEWKKFVEASRKDASGWVGFYWGKTVAECRKSGTIADAIMAEWLDAFRELAPTMKSRSGK